MTAILKVDTIQDTSGNNIINENANTITIGKSGDTVNLASGATNNLGITEADQWRLTADITATNADITANLERCDDASFGKIGTGMSESSGIFTFPSTGVYQVVAEGTFVNGSGTVEVSMDLLIYATINNSSYDDVSHIQNGVQSTSTAYQSGMKSCFIDVTDTSNVKVKFATDSLSAGSQVKGSTIVNETCFTFIRLGDT